MPGHGGWLLSLGGVVAPDEAVTGYTLEVVDLGVERRDLPLGRSVIRVRHTQRAIRLSGEGWLPLDFGSLDYSEPLELVTREQTGYDGQTGGRTWGEVTRSVYARPPQVQQAIHADRYTWTLDCIETGVDEDLIVPSVGGADLPELACLDLTVSEAWLTGGGTVLRAADGTGILQRAWAKRRVSLSGSGWAAAGLPALPTTPVAVAVDGHSWSLLITAQREDYDPLARTYTWAIEGEEE